ncbi:hypothetical protein AC1031_011099 [Aphanomyces cochlioides]|nr:hypothetical protein AC1031_011099 [Aphanomyces cochlioides]
MAAVSATGYESSNNCEQFSQLYFSVQGGKRCKHPGCRSGAKHFGLCWQHGGSKTCRVLKCPNRSKSHGLCWTHGGVKRCHFPECTKTALKNNLCWAHGGGIVNAFLVSYMWLRPTVSDERMQTTCL